MNALTNRVQLIGHVGKEPEVKSFKKGNKVVRILLATKSFYKDSKGERVTDTQWHTLVAWNKTAEIAEKYLVKGKEVAIDGRLAHRFYEAKDGSKKYVTEVIVNDILLLGSSQKQSA